MIIATFVDDAGIMHSDREQEQGEIIKTLRELVFGDEVAITEKHDISPIEARNERFDLYVIDYGGMSAWGAHDLAMSLFRSFVHLVEDFPNRLFIVWSDYSYTHLYKEALQEEFGLDGQPNVLLATTRNWPDKACVWFNITTA